MTAILFFKIRPKCFSNLKARTFDGLSLYSEATAPIIREKFANLISKLNFYKLIPYPMDNMLYRSVQTGPPNVRKRRPVFPPAGQSSHCTRQVAHRTSLLSRQPDVIASFSLSKPIRPLVS